MKEDGLWTPPYNCVFNNSKNKRYGETNYKQTKGGDGGIDGYKFTYEQKLTV